MSDKKDTSRADTSSPATTDPHRATATRPSVTDSQTPRTGTPTRPSFTEPQAEQERTRRRLSHGPAYTTYMREARRRGQLREHLVGRRRILDERKEKYVARLQKLELERVEVEASIESLELAKVGLDEAEPGISAVEDEEIERKWRLYFSLSSDEVGS